MASCLADTKSAYRPFLLDQLRMSAALDDMSVVQYKDLIGVADGFQTVGNHDDGLVMGQCSIARCNSSSFSGSTLLVASSK